jgi:hypothetical protein
MESNDLRTRLIDAAAAGEIIHVVYHRGSQPGTVREIAPFDVGDDEVKARDVAAGIDKTFRLAHLQLAGPDTSAPAYHPTPREDSRTLGSAVEPYIAELQGLGWHVESADTSISVHRFFKNGKRRKGADVAILFNEFSIDGWDDGNGLREEAVKSTRPYYVSSPTFDRARTFARLGPAFALFLEEARRLAPGQRL